MRAVMALTALLLLAPAASGQNLDDRVKWLRQAEAMEQMASGLREAARCNMVAFPSGWSRRMEVTPAAAPGSPLTNIPVAVTIQSANLAHAKDDGSDVLFTSPSDGTTVYPSWRAAFTKAGTPTWQGFVLFPSYTAGDLCLVNYDNDAASEQSTTAALTGGGMTHWVNTAAPVSDGLQEVIAGVSATLNGVPTFDAAAGAWGGWRFGPSVSASFAAGQLQPATPRTVVMRYTRKAGGGQMVFYNNLPALGWAFTTGSPANFGFYPTTAFSGGNIPGGNTIDVEQAVGMSVDQIPLSGPNTSVPLYLDGALSITYSIPAGDVNGYQGLATISNGATLDSVLAELGYFSGVKDANWHAFWAVNTGSVTLSAEEVAVTEPATAGRQSRAPRASLETKLINARKDSRVLMSLDVKGRH